MGRLSSLRRAYGSLYGWATERLYRELAWGYEIVAWIVSLGRWDAWRRQVLDHVIGRRVLEIGFGTGVLLETAVDRGMSIFGVDPSPEMHRVAARRMRRSGRRAPCVSATAQLLPFEDGSFDPIISIGNEWQTVQSALAGIERLGQVLQEPTDTPGEIEPPKPGMSVAEFVEENYYYQITLERAARVANYSEYHFARYFKDAIGITFRDYLENIRIEKAKRLLRNTDTTVTEIAYSTGFTSLKYFCE